MITKKILKKIAPNFPTPDTDRKIFIPFNEIINENTSPILISTFHVSLLFNRNLFYFPSLGYCACCHISIIGTSKKNKPALNSASTCGICRVTELDYLCPLCSKYCKSTNRWHENQFNFANDSYECFFIDL
jgi:hypothetical protein